MAKTRGRAPSRSHSVLLVVLSALGILLVFNFRNPCSWAFIVTCAPRLPSSLSLVHPFCLISCLFDDLKQGKATVSMRHPATTVDGVYARAPEADSSNFFSSYNQGVRQNERCKLPWPPSFFILGVRKAGTTALQNLLQKHERFELAVLLSFLSVCLFFFSVFISFFAIQWHDFLNLIVIFSNFLRLLWFMCALSLGE